MPAPPESGDERGDDEGDDGHQFDEDVHRRAGGILEGIAHGVTDDSGLMRVATLMLVENFR